MTKKAGRPSKYETMVKPRLDEIKDWAKAGATNKEMASALGIHMSTFCDYLNEYSEFRDSVNSVREAGVPDVKLALYKRACGFDYEEEKTYIKKDEDGKVYQYKEITKRKALPDVNAIGMYLRNYSDDFADNDKITNRFKEMELQLRRELAEANNW